MASSGYKVSCTLTRLCKLNQKVSDVDLKRQSALFFLWFHIRGLLLLLFPGAQYLSLFGNWIKWLLFSYRHGLSQVMATYHHGLMHHFQEMEGVSKAMNLIFLSPALWFVFFHFGRSLISLTSVSNCLDHSWLSFSTQQSLREWQAMLTICNLTELNRDQSLTKHSSLDIFTPFPTHLLYLQ